MNSPQIITHHDTSGHWSAYFAGQPCIAFGGDSPHVAALRLMAANPEVPQHILDADHVQNGRTEFRMA